MRVPLPKLPDARANWGIPAVALGLLFIGLVLLEMHQVTKDNVGAFATYYIAGLRMRESQNPYGPIGIYPYVYPPFYAFVCQPLTYLPRQAAARIAAVVDAAILLSALLIAAAGVVGRFGYERNRAAVFWVALITAGIILFPLDKGMRSLQVNGLLVLSVVLALYWLERRPVLAGVALAVGISVKYVPVVGLIYLALRRRWTAAIGTVAGCGLFALLPALSVGWTTNLHYQRMANRGLAALLGGAPPEDAARVHGLAEMTNISVPGTMARLAKNHHWPNSAGLALTVLVLAGWMTVVAYFYHQKRLPLFNWRKLVFAALLLLGFVAAPAPISRLADEMRLPSPAGFAVIALVLLGWTTVVVYFYRKRRVSSWPDAAAQAAEPFRRLLAVEWSLLATLPLVFMPDSEQVFAMMPVTLLAAMLALPGRSRDRRSLIWALALILTAVLLPISLMGRDLTHLWNGLGTPCWLWLIALALIWKHGLGEAAPTN